MQPSPQVSTRYRYTVLLFLALAYCLNYMDRQVIGILAVPIKADLKLTDSELALMGGFAFAIFYSCLGIPVARLADRMSRIKIISVACLVWSACTASCGLANSFGQLLLARLSVGIGEAGGVAPTYSLLSDYFPPRQRGRALAVLTLGLPIGSALGLLLGAIFAENYGWRAAFMLLGAGGIVLAPILFLVVREPPRGQLDAPTGDGTSQPAPTLGMVVRHLLPLPGFWLISFASASASMLSYGLQFWLPTYIYRSHNLSLTTTSYVLSSITIVGGVIGLLLGGVLCDRLGARNKGAYGYVPSIGFVIGMPFMLAAALASGLPATVAFLLLPQVAGVMWMAPAVSSVQHLAPSTMRASASAIFLFIVNLIGLGAGTLAFGGLSDFYQAHFGPEALRYAIITVVVVLYPLTAVLYALAGRKLAGDWQE
ncbi:spinster family MFS transporter [Novosphingobium colocasiae]|uniref:spinster family MFS transporter n=1 Tax=Novosphingobium colocasiae TaxID=1256513 RepID=UPI0035B0D500